MNLIKMFLSWSNKNRLLGQLDMLVPSILVSLLAKHPLSPLNLLGVFGVILFANILVFLFYLTNKARLLRAYTRVLEREKARSSNEDQP